LELKDVIARRRMCRSFLEGPVDPVALERALGMATHAPSAGNTQGWAFVVLEDDETALFWQHEAESSWLAHPSHPGLLNAPVIVLPLASKQSYLERYSEPDKASVGARRVTDWAVPYWLVDTSFATMLLLLGLAQEGLGSLFFALQRPAGPLLRALGVPDGWEPLGAVAIGWPSSDDRPSTSASRPRKPSAEVVHRGRWGQH
jgi:nitroreductase